MNKTYVKIALKVGRMRFKWWKHWHGFANLHGFEYMRKACAQNAKNAWQDMRYFVCS